MKRIFKDIRKYMPYTMIATKCKLKAEIVDFHLGWLWWLLEPICHLCIYVFVFSYLSEKKEEYYPLLVFVGISIWAFFSNSIKSSVNTIKKNNSLLSNVYIPKYMLLLKILFINVLKMLTSLGLCILLTLYYHVRLTINCVLILPALLLLFLLTFGLSCLIMHWGVYIADLGNVLNIVLRLLFYVTGIFYSIPQRFPSRYSKVLLILNPVACIIEDIRENLIYGNSFLLKTMVLWTVIAILISILGVQTVYKNENSYLKVN